MRGDRVIYIGIDPGKKGAWAAVDHNRCLRAVGDMPTLDGNGRINARALWAHICQHIDTVDVAAVAVEDVCSFEMGRQTAFVFGHNAGVAYAIATIIAGTPIPVRPQIWKAHHGLIKSEKSASTKLAREMWGVKSIKNNGQAEAALIADWLCVSLL